MSNPSIAGKFMSFVKGVFGRKGETVPAAPEKPELSADDQAKVVVDRATEDDGDPAGSTAAAGATVEARADAATAEAAEAATAGASGAADAPASPAEAPAAATTSEEVTADGSAPAAGTPGGDATVPEAPAPAAAESAPKKQAAKKPAAKKAPAEKAPAEKPAAPKKPAAKRPAAKKPAAQKSGAAPEPAAGSAATGQVDGAAAEGLIKPEDRAAVADELAANENTTQIADNAILEKVRKQNAPAADALAVPGYDGLTLPSIRARLRKLTIDQVRDLRSYEIANQERAEFIKMYDNRIAKLTAQDSQE